MAAPFRVGILNDLAAGPADMSQQGLAEMLSIPVRDLQASGRIDREVEFIDVYGVGLPTGTAAAVERAFTELVDQHVLLIIGPAIGDNALVATPLAERFRTPTINWAGTERGRSEYMFHLQVGSHEDESIVLARHFADIGAARVAIVHDRSPIGRRHVFFLQLEAEALGLHVTSVASVGPLAEDATAEVASALDAGIDGLLYLGLGLAAPAVARAAAERGWTGPRAMNTAGLRGYSPDFARVIDGWTYLDMHSDRNLTLAAFRARLGLDVSSGPFPALRYDLGRLVAESLARAPERTRDGVRDGLEQVKWLPAAEGHEGTLLGFGNHDRGALHGRYLVLRQWQDGHSVELPV